MDGVLTSIWTWLTTTLGPAGSAIIVAMMIVLVGSERSHRKTIDNLKLVLEHKEKEVERAIADRNDYKQALFKGQLGSSAPDGEPGEIPVSDNIQKPGNRGIVAKKPSLGNTHKK